MGHLCISSIQRRARNEMCLFSGKPYWASLSLYKPKGKVGTVGLVENVWIIGDRSDKTDKILEI